MKLGFSGAGGISPNPPREALKIHPEEDLGALSPFSVLRAPHEARKASKNAFFVFRKNRRLRRPNQRQTHHKPHQTSTKTHTLPIIPHTHHKPPKPQTLPFFMTTQKCLHDNSGTAQAHLRSKTKPLPQKHSSWVVPIIVMKNSHYYISANSS